MELAATVRDDERTALIHVFARQIDALSRRRLRARTPRPPLSPRSVARRRRARRVRVWLAVLHYVLQVVALLVVGAFLVLCLRLVDVYTLRAGVERWPVISVAIALFGGGLLVGWVARDFRK